ncbi:MAG: tyrosine-type recombinase/integrase [Syntrophotaleaceae bacterium]
MPRIKFTKEDIENLQFTGRPIDYFDSETAGLGLRVGKISKTFFCKVDVKDASAKRGYRTVREIIGRFGDITLSQAKKLVGGYDDRGKTFVPGRRLELKRSKTKVEGLDVTLLEMFHQYLSEKNTPRGNKRKEVTKTDYERRFNQHFQCWHKMTLPEIAEKLTNVLLIDLHTKISIANGNYAARNAFVILNAVLNHACFKYPGAMPSNPLKSMMDKKAGILAPIKTRNECLRNEDFRKFYIGIQTFNPATRDCYLLALYQGLRSQEASALRWDQVSLEKNEIRIPDTKNREDLHVPLARQSIEIIRRRRQEVPDENPWVFASSSRLNKTGHVRLTAQSLRDKTGLKMTVHGLRRSFITTGRKLQLAREADRLTNHLDPSISGRKYDETEAEDYREPLQKIVDSMERLMKD